MKAIKDCKWVVTIEGIAFENTNEFYWIAMSKQNCGLEDQNFAGDGEILCGNGRFIYYKNCYENWLRFAELNGIKKWSLKK